MIVLSDGALLGQGDSDDEYMWCHLLLAELLYGIVACQNAKGLVPPVLRR